VQNLALAMLGGAAGSGLRWLLSEACAARGLDRLPWATFSANLVGSLLIGVLARLAADPVRLGEPLRVLLVVGVLGGFTTYSSFNEEVLRLLRDGAATKAIGYVAATMIACLAAGALGHWLAGLAARGA
jgi:CrcB protein